MRFIISTILIMLAAYAACLFFPWWSIAPVAFIVSFFIPIRGGWAFLSGFLALSLLWAFLSYYISYQNEHLLAHKISLLVIKTDSPVLLVLLTAVIGGIVAGFAALSGSLLRNIKK